MALQETPTIGLVELPLPGLLNEKEESLTYGGSSQYNIRFDALPLLSKKILLANLRAAGFDARLIDLRKGDHQGEYGKVTWRNTEYSKQGNRMKLFSP
uniref:Uncharacterized protein n=1 Tax=Candidatus Kentrum sp. LPFa TaxID=2126335 RepID=A0A450X1C8_9GAMM|nr:MAG: hypothetical protein BECKLPF1236A_GA0070988_1000526 [Candidatus Kentron sp. LPFa]VFK23085.1 MAG: hypothetical protein BECKLPF1236C_GA0070990_1000324 [Candidatus Kentron sp. LPFa]